MKRLVILLLLAATVLWFNCNSEPVNNRTFEIKINRWAMMTDSWWTVTADSVVIELKENLHAQPDTFIYLWTDEQRTELARMINSWDTTAFERELLIENVPDCEREFDFVVTLNGKTFKTHAYLEKIEQLYKLTNYVDKSLPELYRMNYNDAYLLQR